VTGRPGPRPSTRPPGPGPWLRAAAPGAILVAVFTAAALGQGSPSPNAVPPPRYASIPVPEAAQDSTLAALRVWETASRAAFDFTTATPGDRAQGPDPFRVAAIPGENRFVVLLRGAAQLLVLDPDLGVVQRIPTPSSPTGLAVWGDHVFVGGELASVIATYRIQPGGPLAADFVYTVRSFRGIRDVTVGPTGVLYAIDNVTNRLVALSLRRTGNGWVADRERAIVTGRGPIRVCATAGAVAVDALLDHRILLYPLDAQGFPDPTLAVSIENDGPFWGFDMRETGDTLLVAAGGVENHPLDRTGGFFGYVDSFLYTFRADLRRGAGRRPTIEAPVPLAALNVSAWGTLTPKCVRIESATDGLDVSAAGYGGWTDLVVAWGANLTAEPTVTAVPAPPGITDTADLPDGRRVAVSPLLDALFVVRGSDGTPTDPAPAVDLAREPRDPEQVLGELLFFTGLMAPAGTSEGAHSRFTCETCHFEGYGDGRVHYTGRGDVHAATKPLRGLFNNKPHFSRALDDDLTEMVNHEFRVAGSETGLDPWFTLYPERYPGLAGRVPSGAVGPGELRRALMRFLMGFSFAPNPYAIRNPGWGTDEAEGAAVFSRHCEGCHQARLIADDPTTRIAAADWKRLIFSVQDPIVWATGEYRKTGVEPYVHENGARVPSLRRLYKKHPYFTNGSAAEITDVLDHVRFDGTRFYHDKAPLDPGLSALTKDERRQLAEFLKLL